MVLHGLKFDLKRCADLFVAAALSTKDKNFLLASSQSGEFAARLLGRRLGGHSGGAVSFLGSPQWGVFPSAKVLNPLQQITERHLFWTDRFPASWMHTMRDRRATQDKDARRQPRAAEACYLPHDLRCPLYAP
jgi:hypothetical protein